jgi:hypothetical protein
MEFVIKEHEFKKAVEARHLIYTLMNPKLGQGQLIYTDEVKTRKIDCIITETPTFTQMVEGGAYQRCLVHLVGNGAYWFDKSETTNVIATWLANFEFSLEFGEGGIEFGSRQDTLITNVKNVGEVETGMRIEFTALGTIENPSLFNINTREYIKVNKTMQEGEKIVIDTSFNNKTITSEANNVKTNIFNSLDFTNSTFLQLMVGDNYFRHDADSGLDNLECRIYYSPKYIGI